MIRALIFDCFGVVIVESVIGERRDDAMLDYIVQQHVRYKTALLSNISSAGLSRRFSAAEAQAYFDVVIASEETGYAKPDPEIYLLATRRLGVLPAEAVMIDDRQDHCDGAIAAGLQAIRYRSLGQLQTELAALTDPE
jgi:HAD superfamily hydrolase (TIGR01509 family)